MKKRTYSIIISIISFFIALIVVLKIISHHNDRDRLNPNTVLFLNTTDFRTEDFKITWKALNNPESSIFENSAPTDLIFKEYGKNFFFVYYKEQLISKYVQFKHNDWHGHTYQFMIHAIDNTPQVLLNVTGPDSERISKYL